MPDSLSIPSKAALGLVAGLSGTAVMTLGQQIEMAATGRSPSLLPAKALETISGVTLTDREDELRTANAIHWGYGTALGIGLVLLDRIPDPLRSIAFLAAVWTGGAALLTGLGLARPPGREEPQMLAIDIGHHMVYAAAAGMTYQATNRFAKRRGIGGSP